MKYNGTELREFTSDRPVVFDPPKKMLVWDDGIIDLPRFAQAMAYIPGRFYPVIGAATVYRHCAEIPEQPEPRRATNRELARWLAQGNGMVKTSGGSCVCSDLGHLTTSNMDDACSNELVIRKWDDRGWHEPTVDYIGLEG